LVLLNLAIWFGTSPVWDSDRNVMDAAFMDLVETVRTAHDRLHQPAAADEKLERVSGATRTL